MKKTLGYGLALAVLASVFVTKANAEDPIASWNQIAEKAMKAAGHAPASAYSMDVPLAYYDLSFTLSKRTGGITPPVQARIFAYMGLALYESVVGGMPRNRSIASSLRGVGLASRNRANRSRIRSGFMRPLSRHFRRAARPRTPEARAGGILRGIFGR